MLAFEIPGNIGYSIASEVGVGFLELTDPNQILRSGARIPEKKKYYRKIKIAKTLKNQKNFH